MGRLVTFVGSQNNLAAQNSQSLTTKAFLGATIYTLLTCCVCSDRICSGGAVSRAHLSVQFFVLEKRAGNV